MLDSPCDRAPAEIEVFSTRGVLQSEKGPYADCSRTSLHLHLTPLPTIGQTLTLAGLDFKIRFLPVPPPFPLPPCDRGRWRGWWRAPAETHGNGNAPAETEIVSIPRPLPLLPPRPPKTLHILGLDSLGANTIPACMETERFLSAAFDFQRQSHPSSTTRSESGTYCLLLTAYCSLLTADCLLLTAHCSLLTATAYCLLLTAHC